MQGTRSIVGTVVRIVLGRVDLAPEITVVEGDHCFKIFGPDFVGLWVALDVVRDVHSTQTLNFVQIREGLVGYLAAEKKKID